MDYYCLTPYTKALKKSFQQTIKKKHRETLLEQIDKYD